MSSSTTRLKVSFPGQRLSDAAVVARGSAVVAGMNGNANFANPPVDIAVLKAAVDNLAAAIAEALDGGKKAISERNRLREIVVNMLRLLAVYVETHCNNEPAILASSGFDIAAPAADQPQTSASTGFDKIEHGNSGELKIHPTAVPKLDLVEKDRKSKRLNPS